jgi:enoyl-CoA hydratase/carnithine racemase
LRGNGGNRTCALIEGLDQVTIAAVNGLAIGGAVSILASMDIRLAARSAWFSIPEADLGIPIAWNALPRLVRELGPARTKELVMTCSRFSSEEAMAWGFVNRVYPDEELLPRATEMAQSLLAKNEFAIAVIKSTVSAIAQITTPTQITFTDRDLLTLARRLGQ